MKSEQYLDSNGRNWRQLYKAYTDAVKAKKAAAAQQAPNRHSKTIKIKCSERTIS